METHIAETLKAGGYKVTKGRDGTFARVLATVAGERPAGLLAGITHVGEGGSPAAPLDYNIQALWSAVRGSNPDRPVFITSANGGLYFASLHVDGRPMFPNARPVDGGDLCGVPLLISPAAGNKLVLLDAAGLGVSDGPLLAGASKFATIQMNSTPVSDATGTHVSGFQHNVSFVKLTRYVSWALAHEDAVAFIELPVAA